MPADPRPLIQELLKSSLPAFEEDLREMQKTPPAGPQPQQVSFPADAIINGTQKYTDIRAPVLAIFALPHSGPPPAVRNDPKALAEYEAGEQASVGAQAKAFEGLSSARVVRLPFASHDVFLSNEADVLREMKAFIGSLP
jgi:hypothetical protein